MPALGRETSAEDDYLSQVYWRRAMARVLASRGEAEGADGVAREALDIAAATDDLITHADTALTLADVLLELGRPEEAGSHAEDALALYEQKGNLVMAERVRQRSRSSQAP